ncbi:MAG: hypothetical protein LLG00_12335 [Planctomycetaceae bacterium]|nr:hypothetical protein [Planctomycetaceae bacterium]
MKRLLTIAVLGALLSVTSGCHIGECWRYAWNSRFHPERLRPQQQQCVTVDPCCDPCCGETVITSGPTVVTPAPAGGGCGCGAGAPMPGPVGR